jgi:hypothetical protein
MKPLFDFKSQARGKFGRYAKCRSCEAIYMTEWSRKANQDPEYRKRKSLASMEWVKRNPEKRAAIAKHRNQKAIEEVPEKVKARALVNQRVRFGRIPRASSCKCTHCENQAAHYHHYLGYEFEHRYDVQPVCIECHKRLG